MNIRNLLVALLLILTQLHASVAQTPLPPDARVGPPQFSHGTKLMYSFENIGSIPDGSILKWATFYYACTGSLITRTSTISIPFVITMTLLAFPYEGEQVETPPENFDYYFYIPPVVIYTKTISLLASDRSIRSFVSDEITVTLDFYKYSYGFVLESETLPEYRWPQYPLTHICQRNERLRLAYLPPVVGINAYLPSISK